MSAKQGDLLPKIQILTRARVAMVLVTSLFPAGRPGGCEVLRLPITRTARPRDALPAARPRDAMYRSSKAVGSRGSNETARCRGSNEIDRNSEAARRRNSGNTTRRPSRSETARRRSIGRATLQQQRGRPGFTLVLLKFKVITQNQRQG